MRRTSDSLSFDPSKPHPDPRREKLAELRAGGRSQADAYREVYPRSRNWRSTTLNPKASRVFAEGNIGARVSWLKEQAASDAIMTLTRRKELLSRIAEEVKDHLPDYMRERGDAVNAGINAIKELNKLEGAYAPQKKQLDIKSEGRPLAELICEAEKICDEMRGRR